MKYSVNIDIKISHHKKLKKMDNSNSLLPLINAIIAPYNEDILKQYNKEMEIKPGYKAKQENPLFKIARDKRKAQFYTYDFPFLENDEANEDTYVLGFCAGVEYCTNEFQKQFEAMQKTIEELKALKTIEDTPTLFTQNENL